MEEENSNKYKAKTNVSAFFTLFFNKYTNKYVTSKLQIIFDAPREN